MEMEKTYVAGVDGGGTKSALACLNPDGTLLSRLTLGPFNLNSIGEEGFSAILKEITAFLREQGRCEAICIGAAGSSNPEMRKLVSQAMQAAEIPCWELVGDCETALYGALVGAPGCALVAGTGSVCFGRNAEGKTARAGGWGHLLGDEGSGYALGRDALTAVARWHDGYGESTGLTEALAKKKNLRTREEMIAYVYGGDKSRIAALAPLVEAQAAAGDPVSCRILEENAAALVRLVEAVTHHLHITDREVALLGGLLTSDTGLRRAFRDQLGRVEPALRCVAPKEPPEIGAALMALELVK